jgi:type IV secretion system protein VirB6
MSGLLSSLEVSVDSYLNKFVITTSSSIATAIAPLVIVGFSIWILTYGYAVMRQEVSDPINVFVKNMIKFALVSSFALGTGIYQKDIIGAVQNLSSGLVSAVSTSSVTSTSGILGSVDSLNDKGVELAVEVLAAGVSKLPMGGWLDLVSGILILFANGVLAFICGGYTLFAKVALSFLLALGPLFIACISFAPTAKLFDAWLGHTLNFVLLPVLMAISVGFSLSIADSYLSAIIAAQSSAEPPNSITDAFSLVTLYAILIFITYQATHISAGLTGGVALPRSGLAPVSMGAVMGRALSLGRNSGGASGALSAGTENQITSAQSSASSSSSSGRVPAYKQAARRKFGK